jgi:tetrahydromethanopterin S-methyltransferase subunit F
LNPTFTFTIGTNAVTGGNTTVVQIPYATFDLQASYPMFAKATNYFPIRRADNESQYAIGRVFLQEAYISVDFEFGIFNVSAANWSDAELDIVTISAKLTPLSSTQVGERGLSSGATAGIVIGCVAAVVLLIACFWLKVVKRTRQKERREAMAKGEVDEKVQRPPDSELTAAGIHELPAKHGRS